MRRYSSSHDELGGLKIISLIIIFIILVPILIYDSNKNKAEIAKQVTAINGEIISIESLGLFEKDPLPLGAKGSSKYKFTYMKDGEIRHGYVLFSYGDTWIMNYKEEK